MAAKKKIRPFTIPAPKFTPEQIASLTDAQKTFLRAVVAKYAIDSEYDGHCPTTAEERQHLVDLELIVVGPKTHGPEGTWIACLEPHAHTAVALLAD